MSVAQETALRQPGTLPAGAATIALLTALAAVGQFASNLYTPALPFVAQSLGVETSAAQLTLAIFMACFAFAQLVHGPLADRFGRRPVLVWSFALFLLGTALCALAPSLTMLLAARAVQAVGAAGALVVSRAATRDSFEGAELSRAIATISIAFAIVPAVTPLAGGLIQQVSGWRMIFWITLILGFGLALLALRRLPETLRTPIPALNTREILAGYGAVVCDRIALVFCLTIGLVFGALAAFFAGSPELFITQLGISPVEYGLYPPVAVIGFVIGGLITRRMAGSVAPQRAAALGLAIMGVSLFAMLLGPVFGLVHKFWFAATMAANVTGFGIFIPIAIAQVLAQFPDRAGTAAAMQGFTQMIGGALGTVAVSSLQGALPILAMPLVMVICVVAASGLFAYAAATESWSDAPTPDEEVGAARRRLE